ncbi:MAG: PAS domain S-box protein [Clostridia bacterium]
MTESHRAPARLDGIADPFRELVAAVTDYAIFLLDAEGRIVSWNPGAQIIKGYSADEIIGRHFSVFYPPEATANDWPRQELEMAASRGRFEDEGWRVRKDGSRFWANVVITALKDPGGTVRGFAKITRDLSQRRREEDLLRESEERFRLMVDAVRDYAIYMLDAEGRVVSWNAGAERISGYSHAEILGKHFSVFYPEEGRRKKWPEQELAAARDQGRFEDEGLRVRKDGSAYWANVVLTPVYEAGGTLRGYAKVTRDLTDRRRVEALEKAERQTNEFLAMLAHELRNPLAPIRNALHLLAKKPTEDPAELWVREVLQRQTVQMTRLVDDLLDVSRITRATVVLSRSAVDVRKAIREAADAAVQWIQPRRHSLVLELPDEPLEVEADPVRLNQIVLNLLHNAAKFTPEGGRITAAAAREGGDVVLRVRDNGIGMTPELVENAFELFRQGQQAIDRPEGGLGVGLTLVERLTTLHGGSVEARSEGPGRGSEFVVRLPARPAGTPAEPPAPAEEGDHGSARRILVVDDNIDAANALRYLLQNDGHDVRISTDGASGLALAREFRPDVLLLDIGLPRLSGYEIARAVRADASLAHATIIAVTGYGQQQDRERSSAAGFDHHLTKPVEFRALQRLLKLTA